MITKRTAQSADSAIREREEEYLRELYRIYEFADGLYFPEMKFRCGDIENYVRTGILSQEEAEEIWSGNALKS